MIVPPSTLEALEFDGVRELLARQCGGVPSRGLALDCLPFEDPSSATEALAETTEARSCLAEEGRPAAGIADDPAGPLDRLGIEGTRLETPDIRSLLAVSAAAVGVRAALWRRSDRWPRLAAKATALPDLQLFVDLIGPHIEPDGGIADSASPELRRLRRRRERVSARVHDLLERMLNRPESESVLSDRFITERSGRCVIPVRTDAPTRPRGIVHSASSSGATVFIEPMETVDSNNEIVTLREQESAEIDRILHDWTARLADRRDELAAAHGALADMDLIFARAALAREMKAVEPVIEGSGGLVVEAARHPLLEEALRAGGHDVVPLGVRLAEEEHTLVISGPNAGGKTVALKTVGLLVVMAHAGMHVPAGRFELPRLEQVVADIGDHQSIAASLSTFSAHIKSIAAMLEALRPPSLVLLDEIGTGTDPDEGAALACSLLEHLMKRGASTIVTTHHGALKAWAFSTPGVASAAVEFDEQALRPTYRLLPGAAGASSGLQIAERLGLDPGVVASARERIAPEARRAEIFLARLRDLLEAAETDREAAGRLRAESEETARRLAEERDDDETRRAEDYTRRTEAIVEELRDKSRRALRDVTDRRDRMKLDRQRARLETDLRREAASEAQRLGLRKAADLAAGGVPSRLEPGDRIVVASLSREAVVEEVDDREVLVRMGSTRMRVKIGDCRVAAQAATSDTGTSGGVSVHVAGAASGVASDGFAEGTGVSGELMVIGQRVDEAIESLDRFLDQAFIARHGQVRIVHGHGTGRLRSAIRNHLSGHTHVASHRPGAAAEGGNGATVAVLRG